MGASFITVIDRDKWQPQMSASIMETQTNKVFFIVFWIFPRGLILAFLTTYIFLLLQKLQEFTYLMKTLADGLYFAGNEGETGGFCRGLGQRRFRSMIH